ncbi:MAG: LysR family transcriptional regulator [Alphaproteobacteria bacterium]|nr:LysR family transcriptional regulator [Alphaproteobacteria bacterium]
MNINQLETFIWVSTLGSFRKAAKKLNTSQPAISSRIASLENLLGVNLFERHAGSFELTAKGVELLPYAQKILVMAEKLKEKASEKTSISGLIRIGVSETIVHTWLSDFLKQAHISFPNVDIEITVDVTTNMRDELVNRSLDLAFLMGPISDYAIHNVDLGAFELNWVCSPDLDFPDGKIPITQIMQKPIMTYARNTRPFAEIQALLIEESLDISRLFPSSSLAASKRMTMDGLGIGMLPTALIQEELKSGELRKLETDWCPSELVFTASYPREPYNTAVEKLAGLAAEIAQRQITQSNTR